MNRFSILLAMMVVIMGLAPEMGLAATSKTNVTVAAGDVKGTLSDATGKPLAGVAITLRKDGRTLKTVISDKAGQFALQEVNAGNYELLMSGMSPLPLRASDRSDVASLKLVLPIRKTYAAAGASFTGFYEWVVTGFETAPVTAGLVTVGVAAAVAVPIAVSTSGGSSGGAVSP